MKNFTRTPLLVLVLVLLLLSGLVAVGNSPQATKGPTGKLLQVAGQVSVNGTSAISGTTVFSDSTIVTRQNSSAVVSLGKLGRVEVLPHTTVKLDFSDANVSVS